MTAQKTAQKLYVVEGDRAGWVRPWVGGAWETYLETFHATKEEAIESVRRALRDPGCPWWILPHQRMTLAVAKDTTTSERGETQ